MESAERENEALLRAEIAAKHPIPDLKSLLSHKSSRVKKIKKKKEVKPKKPIPARIIVCGETGWGVRATETRSMTKILKELNTPIKIEFVVTGTSRGAEQLCVQICKKLGIPVIQVHPWAHIPNSSWLVQNKTAKMFKPTLIINFNENPTENLSGAGYKKIALKQDIDYRAVLK